MRVSISIERVDMSVLDSVASSSCNDVDPWVESDGEEDGGWYSQPHPMAWGRLASVGWFGAASFYHLEQRRIGIEVLISVRNSFFVRAIEGNWPRTGH